MGWGGNETPLAYLRRTHGVCTAYVSGVSTAYARRVHGVCITSSISAPNPHPPLHKSPILAITRVKRSPPPSPFVMITMPDPVAGLNWQKHRNPDPFDPL
jgi:hypothetical protein